MPGPPAARLFDATAHGNPLNPGTCSPNVIIGGRPDWRALSPAAAAKLLDLAKQALETVGKVVGAFTEADRLKHLDDLKEIALDMAKIMGSTDQHACTVVKLLIPDGNGVVTKGSSTVFINGLPACRVGDPIQEVTSVNSIAAGEPTVLIGG